MRYVMFSLLVASLSGPVMAGDGPTEIVVRAADGKCTATVVRGNTDLKALIPETTAVYKQAPKGDAKAGAVSCEVDVPKDKFLARFDYCALASSFGSSCGVTFDFAAGRAVEFSAASDTNPAICSFACTTH